MRHQIMWEWGWGCSRRGCLEWDVLHDPWYRNAAKHNKNRTGGRLSFLRK